jgi:hypothetical protein
MAFSLIPGRRHGPLDTGREAKKLKAEALRAFSVRWRFSFMSKFYPTYRMCRSFSRASDDFLPHAIAGRTKTAAADQPRPRRSATADGRTLGPGLTTSST